MIPIASLQADLAIAAADFGVAYVDGSASFGCIASPIEASKAARYGGLDATAKLRAVLPVASFPEGYSGPTAGSKVNVGGIQYRVLSTVADPHGLAVEVICGGLYER